MKRLLQTLSAVLIASTTLAGPASADESTAASARSGDRVAIAWPVDPDHSSESCWIRVIQPGAGNGSGCMWLPEIDDEVIVAFLNGDPHRPLVLGRLYGADQPPPQHNAPTHSYQVEFPSQRADGTYALAFAPTVIDLASPTVADALSQPYELAPASTPFELSDLMNRIFTRIMDGPVWGVWMTTGFFESDPTGPPRPLPDEGPSLPLSPQLASFGPTLRSGVFVAAGDISGDGAVDLIVGQNPGAPFFGQLEDRPIARPVDLILGQNPEAPTGSAAGSTASSGDSQANYVLVPPKQAPPNKIWRRVEIVGNVAFIHNDPDGPLDEIIDGDTGQRYSSVDEYNRAEDQYTHARLLRACCAGALPEMKIQFFKAGGDNVPHQYYYYWMELKTMRGDGSPPKAEIRSLETLKDLIQANYVQFLSRPAEPPDNTWRPVLSGGGEPPQGEIRLSEHPMELISFTYTTIEWTDQKGDPPDQQQPSDGTPQGWAVQDAAQASADGTSQTTSTNSAPQSPTTTSPSLAPQAASTKPAPPPQPLDSHMAPRLTSSTSAAPQPLTPPSPSQATQAAPTLAAPLQWMESHRPSR